MTTYVILSSNRDHDSTTTIGPFGSFEEAEKWVEAKDDGDQYRSSLQSWWEQRLGAEPLIEIVGPETVDYLPEVWEERYETLA